MDGLMTRRIRRISIVLAATLLGACAVGPEYERPVADLPETWSQPSQAGLGYETQALENWWAVFEDPVLDALVETAVRNNNTLEIAGLRVLEAQAQLGIATGLNYPQVQVAAGDASYISPPATSGVASNYWQFALGASASWEIDFWGRFRRGIESADGAYLASIAAYDQARVLLTAAVVDVYTIVRLTERQLQIAEENVAIQQRSYEIAEVLYRNGADSELDMQQASTLLLSTQATIPGYETAVQQSLNALNVLLGSPPGSIDDLVDSGRGLPALPDIIETLLNIAGEFYFPFLISSTRRSSI